MVSDFDYIVCINYNNEGIGKIVAADGYGVHHSMEGLYLILSLPTQLLEHEDALDEDLRSSLRVIDQIGSMRSVWVQKLPKISTSVIIN